MELAWTDRQSQEVSDELSDPNLLAALISALERDPESTPLRLHVAELLVDSGGEAAALSHVMQVLDKHPDDRAALTLAIRACEALGDSPGVVLYKARLAETDRSAGEPLASGGRHPSSSRAGGSTISRDKGSAKGEVGPESVAVSASGNHGGWWDVGIAGVTWADVGGMEAVKRRLTVSLIGPMRNPEVRKAYGKSLRGGLLLYGPPGCGKTFIARATAGELEARFMAIGLHEVLDMWLGESEKHVHDVFEVARRNAPCVVFFDELDAIGQKRTNLRYAPAQRGIVNQLLAELDGFQSANEGVFVLAATNHPWDIDSALVRPGRFDRLALVVPPDEAARSAILKRNLVGRPVAIDADWLAKQTEGFSGADLHFLVESAIESAIEESLTTGRVRSVVQRDFQEALGEVRPSTRAWFGTARNFVLFANEGGLYDELMLYMKSHRLL